MTQDAKNKSSIYRGLRTLRGMIYGLQFSMSAKDRRIYAPELLRASRMAMFNFMLAFDSPEKKTAYLMECMAWFGALRNDLEFLVGNGIIRFRKRKPKDPEVTRSEDPSAYEDKLKTKLLVTLAKTDEGMLRWRASLARGTTAPATRSCGRERL